MSDQFLVIAQIKNPLEIFDGNAAKVLKAIEGEVGSVVFDLEVPSQRKACASLARKVSSSKTYLDSIRKELVSGWKAKSKVADAEGKLLRDGCDALRDKIRAPLTEWENEEKAKEAAFLLFKEIGEAWDIALVDDEDFNVERDRLAAIQAEADREAAIKAEELAKQSKLDQEKREARIAEEAAEKATKDAERKAADAIKAAEQRAEQEKRNAEDAEKRTEKRIADELAETNRVAKAAARAEERKASGKRHKARINNESLEGFVALGLSAEQAKEVVIAIASGKVPNVSINYLEG
jgi:hypothetical protein